jgi:uncharacterized protein (TIGR02186 family)
MRALPLCAVLALLPFQATTTPAPAITLAVSKAEIHITAGFHGDILKVTGMAPRDCEVILRLSSPPGEETLDLKGKRGPLWMTVGKVRFESAPRIYMLRSTRPIEEILPPEEQVRETLGVEGLKASLRIQPGVDAALFGAELLRMKRDCGFYDTKGGGATRGGDGTYEAEFQWPARGPSGTYRMDAFAVSKGVVTCSASREILVHKVGVVAWISGLAVTHGLSYGLLAVFVALLTGLAAGVLFGRLGRTK